jgi:heme-degrading monooxygenase HmoA
MDGCIANVATAAATSMSSEISMYSATFIFAKKQFDEAFHALDARIAQVAKSLPGYLGEESWENPANGLVSNVYYWETLADLQRLVQHPSHLQAKASQGNWLAGYRVVIAEVVRVYGDAQLDHLLAVKGAVSPLVGGDDRLDGFVTNR